MLVPIMNTARPLHRLLLLALTVVPFVATMSALAQIDDPTAGAPPTPTLQSGLSLGLSYFVMFVLLVMVVVVSLYPSKRSHQD